MDIDEAIDLLAPDGGYWNVLTRDYVRNTINIMAAHGIPIERCVDILAPLMNALRSEYGD